MPCSINLAKAQGWESHRPQGGPITIIVLLNGHIVKLSPKYSCLCTVVFREYSHCHAQ